MLKHVVYDFNHVISCASLNSLLIVINSNKVAVEISKKEIPMGMTVCIQMQWYRLQEEEEPSLSQYSISDSESDDSCSRETGTALKANDSIVFPPSSGSFKQQKKFEFSKEGEVPMTSLFLRNHKPRRPEYSLGVSKMDAETQTSRLEEGPRPTSGTSTVSLDDLWRRFLKMQISLHKRTQANKKSMHQCSQISCKPDEQQTNETNNEVSDYREKRDSASNSTESSSSPSSDVLHEERMPEVVAFDISPGIRKQHVVSQANKLPSLQPVTLQEALLHRKPLFGIHTRERQKAVQEKRERRVRNKPSVTRVDNEKMCGESGWVWPLADRHHRPERRRIGRREAVKQTKRSKSPLVLRDASL